MSKISRRRFLHNTALLGATLPFGYTTRKASAQTTSTLDLYIAIWPNFTRTKLSWKTSSPQQLAKEFSYMLWNYIQSHGHGLLAAIFSKKKSILDMRLYLQSYEMEIQPAISYLATLVVILVSTKTQAVGCLH